MCLPHVQGDCSYILTPRATGAARPWGPNVKNCINDNWKSFKYSELRPKLSLNLYKHLQNAASRSKREMEVLPLLTKMSAPTTSLATRIVTMVSVKYSVFCFRVSRGSEHSLWRHHGHENKQLKSAQCQRKVSAVSGRHIWTVWHLAGISGKCRDISIDFSGISAWRWSH